MMVMMVLRWGGKREEKREAKSFWGILSSDPNQEVCPTVSNISVTPLHWLQRCQARRQERVARPLLTSGRATRRGRGRVRAPRVPASFFLTYGTKNYIRGGIFRKAGALLDADSMCSSLDDHGVADGHQGGLPLNQAPPHLGITTTKSVGNMHAMRNILDVVSSEDNSFYYHHPP